jgi:NADH-quinone oxidoreductase subunit E
MANINTFLVNDEVIDKVIATHNGKPGSLLNTLEEVQELNPFKYLPEQTLTTISGKMKVPLTQVFSVVTFYSFFNLKPQGKNTIVVCRGTACHTKGSKALLNDVADKLGVPGVFNDGESTFTTADNQFTIKTVACFGQCALSPVVAVNGVIYSNVNAQKLSVILKKIK